MMLKLRCTVCGKLFDENEKKLYTDRHGFESPPYETYYGCPCCGGAFDEIEPCKICGSYYHDEEEEYCDECKRTVKKRFSDFMDKSFSKEERQLLNELYDGEKI